ncbi:MAG: hypothetical protein K8F92_20255 [Hyphomicrobium sp.]|uniref:hypothetical protein n=1 Tax=Hyphomicrobium sp. TaxID=82 RepID=UPI0013278A65|nr:hypothetical protein [Hyphomicrobium sp.]KAB2942780.1 MAG: hypothetical protein F9K20_04700 [Hyphomicrobium sp.]MBZ0211967.1 hypothetical protein [Hyphomicrobium sp.]
MPLRLLLLTVLLAASASSPLSARECKYRELQSMLGEKMTMTAKIDMIEPEEDDPKAVWVTLDNSAFDHCLTFLTGVPKPALGKCKVGQQITATGKVYERMDAWWGLQKVTGIACK